jgi:hypothetical protein
MPARLLLRFKKHLDINGRNRLYNHEAEVIKKYEYAKDAHIQVKRGSPLNFVYYSAWCYFGERNVLQFQVEKRVRLRWF